MLHRYSWIFILILAISSYDLLTYERRTPDYIYQLTGFATIRNGASLSVNGEIIHLHGIRSTKKAVYCENITATQCQLSELLKIQKKLSKNEVLCTIYHKSSNGNHFGSCKFNRADVAELFVTSGIADNLTEDNVGLMESYLDISSQSFVLFGL